MRAAPVQAAAASVLGLYVAAALRCTRWSVHGAEHLVAPRRGAPVLAAFWHERLPLSPAVWGHVRRTGVAGLRMHVLVSRHRDGRFFARLIRRFGVEVVHGSSERPGRSGGEGKGGAAALRALVGVVAQGGLVAITPDGPRGPARRAAAGVAQLAALSGAPVLPVSAQCTRRVVLGTWDRMVLPLPFGRGVVVCGAPIAVARGAWREALPGIEAALDAVSDEADRLCG
ncbi:MAG: lysophospholipid acyltransferase family protein [Janthinobacterium lividum]